MSFLKKNIFLIIIVFGFSFSFFSYVQASANDCGDSGDQCTGALVSCNSLGKDRKPAGDLSCTQPTATLCCKNRVATCDPPGGCSSSCVGAGDVNLGPKNCPTGQTCCTPGTLPPVTVACTGSDERCGGSCLPATENYIGVCGTSAPVGSVCCKQKPPNLCASQGGTCQSSCPFPGVTKTATDCTTSPNFICCAPDCTGTPKPAGCPGSSLPGASASIAFPNPISGAGNSVEGVVVSISGKLQGIIVVLALVFIVIGAVIYVTSAGNDERMKTAKAAITASMIGLALAIAAPSFLKEIYSVLGGDLCKGLSGTELANCNQSIVSIASSSTQSLTQLSLKVLQFLLSIIGILGIIMLVIGGLAYLTSAGDEERSQSGKKIITYAIIGIAVALASLIIVTQVAKLFV